MNRTLKMLVLLLGLGFAFDSTSLAASAMTCATVTVLHTGHISPSAPTSRSVCHSPPDD